MYRHYAELAALKARLETFSWRLDAHVRAFVERDLASDLRNGSTSNRHHALSGDREDGKTVVGPRAT